MEQSALFLPAETEKKDLKVVGEVIRVLADASQTGSYEVFEQHGPEGVGPPPHFHPWDEAFFMLEGEMDVVMGDRTIVLTPGAFAHAPGGTVHAFRYRSNGGRFLSFTSSGGAARFFTELAAALPDGVVNVPRIISIAARHGCTIALPPQ